MLRLHHERLYRSAATMRRLADVRVTICGAGALGANLADTLARQALANLRVVDRDRVEELIQFAAHGERRSFTITLGDYSIRPLLEPGE